MNEVISSDENGMSTLPNPVALQFFVYLVAGWVSRRQQVVIAYLLEENAVLREQLGGRRLRLSDAQRRRLAVKGRPLGRKVLSEIAGIVSPDTIVYWTVCRTFPVPVRGQAGAAGVVGGEAEDELTRVTSRVVLSGPIARRQPGRSDESTRRHRLAGRVIFGGPSRRWALRSGLATCRPR